MKKHRIISSIAVLALSIVMAATVTAAEADLPSAGNPTYRVLDISEYNGTAITWAKVKPNFDIVYLRASIKQGADGVVRKDKYVTTNSNNARANGFHVGYYHYFRPSLDAAKNIAQADFYFDTLKTLSYDCVPVIDVEEKSEIKSSADLSREQISTAVLQFVNRFEQLSGIKPMIYASAARVDEYLDSRLSSCKFWVASWNGKVSTKGNTVFSRWDMWQQAGDVYTTGVAGTVDTGIATSNVLLGSNSGLQVIDSPTGTYSYKDIGVAGWALSYYDIERVDIYVDGKSYRSVMKEDFYDRTDIEKAFTGKGYTDPLNSGYSITIPKGYLGNGEHKVQVALITNKGASWSSTKYFNVSIPKDQILMDGPSGTYTGDVGVYGWAISPLDINKIDVYVDGKNIHSIMGDELYYRGDIASIFESKGYNVDKSGFSYTIPKGTVGAGSHTIKLALTNNTGEVTWTGSKTFTVSIPKDQILMDAPSGTYTGDVGVYGWAVSCSEVDRIDVNVDGKVIHSIAADNLYYRSDIATLFGAKGYNVDKTGYSYTIKKGTLSAGSHTIKLGFINKTGAATWTGSRTFNVSIPKDQILMDGPSGNYTGDIGVYGWAISPLEANRIDVYVDGKCIRSIMSDDFYYRKDIDSIFGSKGYNVDKTGYSYSIPRGTLSKGSHSIRLAFINKAGGVTWTGSRTFNVNIPTSKLIVDTPNKTYNDDFSIYGWALTGGIPDRIDVYVDGKFTSTGSYKDFYYRSDIASIFKGEGYTNIDKSGFSIKMPIEKFSNGSHTASIALIETNGKVTWVNRSFKTDCLESRMCLDTPNGTYSGDVSVSGWALNAFGVQNVDIYVNGELKKTIDNDSLFARNDVKNVYSSYGYTGFDKCGFSASIAHDEFKVGSNTVKVCIKDTKGNITKTLTRTITIN